MPLFEESRVLHSFRDRHECLHVSDPLLWAAGNVVLALSLQSNVQHDGYGQQDQDSPTVHFVRKAMSVTDQLCTIQPTRLTAQVLIGIAKVWQSTSTPQAATFFLAMAVKQIHLLGLDVDKSSERDNAESGEWSRRVLWHAYTLDKDFSLRLEQPLSLKDEDIDAAMPSWSPKDGLGSLTARDDAFRINYFRIRSNLGLIQARIYNRLYSRQSLRQAQPDLSENAESVCDLVNMLLAWKSQVPIEFAAMSLTENFSAESMVALVVLYLHYFNCMMVAHRLSVGNLSMLSCFCGVQQSAFTLLFAEAHANVLQSSGQLATWMLTSRISRILQSTLVQATDCALSPREGHYSSFTCYPKAIHHACG